MLHVENLGRISDLFQIFYKLQPLAFYQPPIFHHVSHNGITLEILGMQILKCTCHDKWVIDDQLQEDLLDMQMVKILVEIAAERVRSLTPEVVQSWVKSALGMELDLSDKENLEYIEERRKELQQLLLDFDLLEIRKVY